MSLAAARGPLAPDRAGRFSSPLPAGLVYVEPHRRRIQALIGSETVLDTESALLVHRPGSALSYAFPTEQVRDLPHEFVPEAPGYALVPWDAVDVWIEEGRRLVHYPPNPYHRVDCRPTRRRLRVEIAGVVLVDTDETIIVFETGLEPKLYASKAAISTEYLRRTETSTYCNYKGYATYWSAIVGDVVFEDVAWSYEDPLPESVLIKGCLSFDPEGVGMVADIPPEHGM